MKILFLLAISFSLLSSASAQIYEGFNYAQNINVTGQNGGNGWGGSWQAANSGTSASVTNPFTYPGVSLAGGALGSVYNQNNPTRVFGSTIAGTSGTSVRFSFILSAGSSCSIVGLRVWDSNSNDYIEPGCANNKWKINTNAGANYAAANSFSGSGAKYVVVQIDFQNGNDRMRLWVNPTVLTNLASDPITAGLMLDITTTDIANLNKVEWVSTNSLSIDEIRIEKVPSGGAANDYFGSSVDIWTDGPNSLSYIVVGAPRCDMNGNIASPASNGKAYVYTFNSSGMVNLVATLSASDATAGDCFGRSVAIYDRQLIIGANKADGNSGIDQGKAYIFSRNSSGWVQSNILTATDAAAGDEYGISVDISLDYAIVGAFQAEPAPGSPSVTNQGQAYIFERNFPTLGMWGQRSVLTATEPPTGIQNNDQFGSSVAIDSSGKALVGAILKDAPGIVDKGAVYAFARQNTLPFWKPTIKLTDSSGTAGSYFGTSVAIDPISKLGLVGAFGTKNPTNSEGKAFLFDGNSNWTPAGIFSSTTPNQGDGFGWSVAIWGSAVIVGEYYGENATATPQNSGAAFFSRKLGSTWTAMQQRTGNPTAGVDYFGNSVAISGNISVIGAPFSDVGANADQGRAFIYTSSVTNPTQYYVLTN
ncbi:MAG: FG-GAP repeat protein [Pyrinomonadaceae bacterium]|nr:FG-GAP repeat protein [Pyrinomonadaceae bacterium]